jgi:hypothetical protein
MQSRTQPDRGQRSLRRRSQPRAGLAPLELVLSLPLLLCVMALMINFGNAATWKIRGSIAARLAVWRARPLWGASSDPKPANWFPVPASMGVQATARIASVDTIWNQPQIAQTWIKGPMFSAGGGYISVRDKRVAEMSEGIATGNASITMPYPFMPGLGKMSLRADHTLAQTLWQYHSMGYGYNSDRRAKGWWNLEDAPDWAAKKQIFLQADQTMRTNPQRELLRPLDRDPDLMTNGSSFDFYPRAPVICSNNPQEVQQSLSSFLDKIPGKRKQGGVNRTMATAYLQMYAAELAILETMMPPPAGRIAQLETWIKQLTDFIATLP